jgi:KipI family sensor histidine kinase inhibitor
VNLLDVGRSALLVEVGSTQEALALYDAARAAGVQAADVVPAARTVLLDGVGDVEGVRRWLREWWRRDGPAPPPSERHSHVELPTSYDGPDLEDVARLWDMTPAEVVAVHSGTTFTVAFCGFAPGFAYCTGLDRTVPRLDSPRPRVEPGSVGLAAEFTGVYPTASPGGWRLVGRTDATLWDPTADEPALLTPGTTVRFVCVS